MTGRLALPLWPQSTDQDVPTHLREARRQWAEMVVNAMTSGTVTLDMEDLMACKDALSQPCSHRVRVHLKTLFTPDVSEAVQLESAQKVFGGFGLAIDLISAESLKLPQFNERSYPDLQTGQCQLAQTTSKQETLFSQGSFGSVQTGDVVVYFVRKVLVLSGEVAGCAAHPLFTPRLIVAKVGSQWTLAHELGHTLGLAHDASPANVMFSPTSGITVDLPGLTSSQVASAKASLPAVLC